MLEAADSGRGSWTSCSSSSHDNFQSLQNQKSWDFLNSYRHTHLGDPIAEVEPPDCELCACPKGCSRTCSQCKGSLETNQLRQSWASSSSLSDTWEPNYGTVKRRVLESTPAEAPDGLEPRDTSDPVYKTVTSSTDKGLIGECRFVCITDAEALFAPSSKKRLRYLYQILLFSYLTILLPSIIRGSSGALLFLCHACLCTYVQSKK